MFPGSGQRSAKLTARIHRDSPGRLVIKRRHFFVRSIVAICGLFVLSGCISGSHDISTDHNQVYPAASGEYSTGSTTYSIVKTVDGYDCFSYGTKAPSGRSRLRFFRISEYSGLVLQYEVDRGKFFIYALVQTDGKNVTIYQTPTASGVKQLVAANYLNNLLKKNMLTETGYSPPTIRPAHPARDTVRVLREIARRKIDLDYMTLTKSVAASVPAAIEPGDDCDADDSIGGALCRSSTLKSKNREMIAGYRLLAERLPSHALAQLRNAQDAWHQELSACAGKPGVSEPPLRHTDCGA